MLIFKELTNELHGFFGPSVLMSSDTHFLSKYFVVNLPLKILETVVLWEEKKKKNRITSLHMHS